MYSKFVKMLFNISLFIPLLWWCTILLIYIAAKKLEIETLLISEISNVKYPHPVYRMIGLYQYNIRIGNFNGMLLSNKKNINEKVRAVRLTDRIFLEVNKIKF